MFKKLKMKIAVALRNCVIKKLIKNADKHIVLKCANHPNRAPMKIGSAIYKYSKVAIKVTCDKEYLVEWGMWSDKPGYIKPKYGTIASGYEARKIWDYMWKLEMRAQRKAFEKELFKNQKREISNTCKMVRFLHENVMPDTEK